MRNRTRSGLPLRAALVAAAASVLLPESAAAQDRAALLLSDRPAPRSGCRVEAAAPPGAVDSAGLHAALGSLAGVPAGATALYSVRLSEGRVAEVAVVESTLPEASEGEVRAALAAHLGRDSMPIRAFRVRVEPGAREGRVRVGRSEVCLPRVMRSVELDMGALMAVPSGTVRIRARVSPQGEVTRVWELSASNPRYGSSAANHVRFSRAAPGLIDGVAVEMEIEQMVSYRGSRDAGRAPR